ncbi:MAG: hypothetical protein Q9195_002036 [Heterodermia aff. obscurata]
MADRMSMRQSSPPPIPSRRSRQPSDPNVFSDEHALDTFDTPDPLPSHDAEAIQSSSHRRPTRIPSTSESISLSPLESIRRSRNSYGLGGVNSTPSTGRFPRSTAPNVDDGPSGSIHREPSDASTSFIPRAQSPYQGTTGPSHPYALYSQDQDNGVSRAPSNATVPPTRTSLQNYSGSSGPSHPYGMYAQNTVSEEDLAITTLPRRPPTAAMGPTQTYQRRMGPDGEDADDLIGPDGHTEQLPPYTKYPNDLPPKERITIPERVVSPVQGTLQDSQETLNNSPAGYAEDRSLVFHPGNTGTSAEHAHNLTDTGSSTQLNSPPPGVKPSTDEGGNFKEVTATRNKSRICGILPLWLLVIIIVAVVVVVIGATVGGVLRHEHMERELAAARSSQVPAATVTVTSLIDAEPLSATPSNLPTLPIGSYAVPLKSPTITNSECLENIDQRSAWACADGPSVNLEIISSGTVMPQINISTQNDNHIHYGPQPPQLTHPADLKVMSDKNDPARGPAYFFQQLYNKTVILRSQELDSTSSSKRWSIRDIEAAESRAKRRRGSPAESNIAVPYDRPWYCFWNETILEGFIYATQPNGNAVQTSAPLPSASTPFGASSFGLSVTPASPSYTSLVSSPSSAASGPWLKRRATGLPCPKIVKLEERRTQLSPKPYCQQMQILENWDLVLADPPVNISLDEDEPTQQHRLLDAGNSGQSRRTNGAFRKSVRDMDPTPGACQCSWVNG